jgi:tRNA-2-methylthio-N6-dimethylallyladenosine synthase
MSEIQLQTLKSANIKLRVLIETFGCQMNEYDSELVRSILSENGFSEARDLESADVVLINTCAVRENAHNRVYGRLQQLAKYCECTDKEITIGVLGCMAQNLKLELLNNNLSVELVVGPDSYRNLPHIIQEARKGGHELAIDLSEFETYDDIYPARQEGVNAWIAVMRGCDNFCTFCIVPYTRGRERSRSLESVVAETQRLVAEGYSQVTLLGQNVNSYHHDGHTFAALMRAVADVPGIRRVRFTSPHPKDFPDDLLQAIQAHPHICKHIHLPLQAGSDRILNLMRRLHTAAEYVALTERIRRTIPDIVLTTDILLGFPSETREDFEATVRTMEQVKFDSAYIFNYSERKGTAAHRRWPDDVPPKEKKYRITLLNNLQKKISLEQNRRHIGRIQEVLVEGPSRRNSNDWSGRNDGGISIIFPHRNELPGDYVKVKISSATAVVLKGQRI